MDIDIGCSFGFGVPAATHAVMLFEPHSTELQNVVDSRIVVSGDAVLPPSSTYIDTYGNRCRRITFDPPEATVTFMARVNVSDALDEIQEAAELIAPHDLPDEVLYFLMPSRYCESDRLSDLAWSQFGSIQSGWARVQTICDWVHGRTTFQYGSSSPEYSAVSVYERGIGVCRDFTHLAIALCRAVNIPARYVFGYLPDIGVPVPDPDVEMDFCAWMEVFLDGRWFTFDPRNNQRRRGRVVIGRGRDAADVAMITSFGLVEMVGMTVWAEPGTGESWNDPTLPRRQGRGLIR
jgi:transglutaminase-like putative cysteine protease